MKCTQQFGISLLVISALMQSGFAAAEAFVAPFGGYSFGMSDFSSIDNTTQEVSTAKVAESEHWGIMAGVTTPDPGNVYLLYSHQPTKLAVGSDSTQAQITDLSIDYLHIGGSLYFPKGKFRPYITTSAGLTQMRPSGAFSNETNFSLGIGGGAEYQLTPRFSLFADIRAYANFISSSKSLFCDSGDCTWLVNGDLMWQGQVNMGAKLMF